MGILIYDLAMADDRRFSPYCWRTRMALWHKGLEFETRPTAFTEIKTIADGKRTTVPVMDHDGRIIQDSYDIAVFLDETYPQAPSLFKGEGGRASTRFIESWAFHLLRERMLSCYVKEIHDGLVDADKDYFRSSRETRFGKPLEEIQAGRESRVDAYRQTLAPLATTLGKQPFLGGDTPLFADYIVFGTLHSQRVVTSFAMLPEDPGDPIRVWYERCLDLFDGAARKLPLAA